MKEQAFTKIGFIGFGMMGEALYKGLKKHYSTLELRILEKSPQRQEQALKKYKAIICNDKIQELFDESEVLVLAIKPQDLANFGKLYKDHLKSKKIISILAATRLDQLQALGSNLEVARLMPNLAASVGKAVTGVSYSDNASQEFQNQAKVVASAMGEILEIPERLMSAVTGISGSGLALVFQFISALALGGTKLGIPYKQSLETSLGVIEGAIEVLRKEAVHPEEMISRVCSPAGTTIEGIAVLKEQGFEAAVIAALQAIQKRADELETKK